MKFVVERNIYYYNRKYNQELILKEKDKIYLFWKNIETKKPNTKLDYKKLKLFKIKKIKEFLNYKLTLSKSMNIYSIFYISLFKLVFSEIFKTSETEIISTNQNIEYKMEKILDCKYIKNKIKYLMK